MDRKITIVENEQNEKIIKSFKLKDTLSEDMFLKKGEKYILKDNIRKQLIKISDEFIDFLGLDFFIHDIVLTGSIANYNWSSYSDIDIHLIIDMDEVTDDKFTLELLKEFFNTKRTFWNDKRNIKIENYDVELYVQDTNEDHVSSGVYSILNNEWVVEPKIHDIKIDKKKIIEKVEFYQKAIDKIESDYKNDKDVSKEVDKLIKKIIKFRKSGLEKGGDYSYENLTFKLLRRNNYMGKLMKIKNLMIDKKLSL